MNKTASPHRLALARRLKRDVQRMAALLDLSDDDGLDGLDDHALQDLGLSAGDIDAMQARWSGNSPFARPSIAAGEWL